MLEQAEKEVQEEDNFNIEDVRNIIFNVLPKAVFVTEDMIEEAVVQP